MNKFQRPNNPDSETLTRLKRWPRLAERFKGRDVYIRSGQWGMFWRENRCGYCGLAKDAGVYKFEEAYQSTHHCGEEKCISYFLVEEWNKLNE